MKTRKYKWLKTKKRKEGREGKWPENNLFQDLFNQPTKQPFWQVRRKKSIGTKI